MIFIFVLVNLGEQPIYNDEIFAQGTIQDKEVFGYQERFAEYKFLTNEIAGEFKSDYATPLDSQHYADDYANLPVLGPTWIVEDKDNVSRNLAIQSQDQIHFCGFIEAEATRELPVYAEPGLLDHM